MTEEDLVPTRWSLVNRLKDWEDQVSWKEFYDIYWRLIRNMVLKAGLNESEAQDVVQETVVSVAKGMAAFEASPESGRFKSWLLLITRRRIADQFRKRDKHPAKGSNPSQDQTQRTSTIERIPDPSSLDLISEWDVEWEKNLLHTARQRVKAQVTLKQYQIYDLSVTKEWPARRIARSLHVNIGQVYLAKHRVGRLLQSELKKLKNAES